MDLRFATLFTWQKILHQKELYMINHRDNIALEDDEDPTICLVGS